MSYCSTLITVTKPSFRSCFSLLDLYIYIDLIDLIFRLVLNLIILRFSNSSSWCLYKLIVCESNSLTILIYPCYTLYDSYFVPNPPVLPMKGFICEFLNALPESLGSTTQSKKLTQKDVV